MTATPGETRETSPLTAECYTTITTQDETKTRRGHGPLFFGSLPVAALVTGCLAFGGCSGPAGEQTGTEPPITSASDTPHFSSGAPAAEQTSERISAEYIETRFEPIFFALASLEASGNNISDDRRDIAFDTPEISTATLQLGSAIDVQLARIDPRLVDQNNQDEFTLTTADPLQENGTVYTARRSNLPPNNTALEQSTYSQIVIEGLDHQGQPLSIAYTVARNTLTPDQNHTETTENHYLFFCVTNGSSRITFGLAVTQSESSSHEGMEESQTASLSITDSEKVTVPTTEYAQLLGQAAPTIAQFLEAFGSSSEAAESIGPTPLPVNP